MLFRSSFDSAIFTVSKHVFLTTYLFFLGLNVNTFDPVFEWFRLTKFQQLLLIKALRFDVLASSVAQFIQDQLGAKYLSTGTFDLHEIYNESVAKSPLIFILSPGIVFIFFN